MSAFSDFWDGFVAVFDRLPVWLPATQMRVGDVGKIDKRGYIKQTDLAGLGIPFEAEPLIGEPPEYNFSSKGCSSHESGIEGNVPEQVGVKAGVKLEASFSRAGAFLVQASGVSGRRISNVLEVESEIQQQLNSGKNEWVKSWIYVQEVVSAEKAILLVSNDSKASATVASEAHFDVSGVLGAKGQLRLTSQSSLMRYVVSDSSIPLMWRGRWLRGFFGPAFTDRGGDVGELANMPAFEFFNSPELFSWGSDA